MRFSHEKACDDSWSYGGAVSGGVFSQGRASGFGGQMSGFSYLGTCWTVFTDAQQAQCEQAYPISGSDASGAFVVSCSGVSATGLLLVRSDASGAAAAVDVPVTYAGCDPAAIGSLVITPDLAGAAFSWGFSGVLICYVLGWSAGQVLAAISRW